MAFRARTRIWAMRWKQCLREGGTGTDLGMPEGSFASAAIIQQGSLSTSTTEGDKSFKQTPKLDLKQL